jgi:hypothetical protein
MPGLGQNTSGTLLDRRKPGVLLMNYTNLASPAPFISPRKNASTFPRWAPFTRLAILASLLELRFYVPQIKLAIFTPLHKLALFIHLGMLGFFTPLNKGGRGDQ